FVTVGTVGAGRAGVLACRADRLRLSLDIDITIRQRSLEAGGSRGAASGVIPVGDRALTTLLGVGERGGLGASCRHRSPSVGWAGCSRLASSMLCECARQTGSMSAKTASSGFDERGAVLFTAQFVGALRVLQLIALIVCSTILLVTVAALVL